MLNLAMYSWTVWYCFPYLLMKSWNCKKASFSSATWLLKQVAMANKAKRVRYCLISNYYLYFWISLNIILFIYCFLWIQIEVNYFFDKSILLLIKLLFCLSCNKHSYFLLINSTYSMIHYDNIK